MIADQLGDECSVPLASAGEWRRFTVSDWDVLDAQWESYVSGGRVLDRIVHTEYPQGGALVFLVSEIRAMDRCSREDRRRSREYFMASEAEKRADGILE